MIRSLFQCRLRDCENLGRDVAASAFWGVSVVATAAAGLNLLRRRLAMGWELDAINDDCIDIVKEQLHADGGVAAEEGSE